jgi:hypothetical protein
MDSVCYKSDRKRTASVTSSVHVRTQTVAQTISHRLIVGFYVYYYYYYYYYYYFSGSAAQRGLWPPRSRGFLITNNDAPQSVGLLWTSDQLIAETST